MKVSINTSKGPFEIRAYDIKAGLAITKHIDGMTKARQPRVGRNYVVTHIPTGKTISVNAAWQGFRKLEEAKRFLTDMATLGDWSMWATADDVPAAARKACCEWS